jgi:hypothetical protein
MALKKRAIDPRASPLKQRLELLQLADEVSKKRGEVCYLSGFHYFFPNARTSRISWL